MAKKPAKSGSSFTPLQGSQAAARALKSSKKAAQNHQNAPESPKSPLAGSHTLERAHTPLFAKWPVWALILALMGVVGGTVLFICAAAGVFSSHQTTLSPEYYSSDTSLAATDGAFLELLTPERYQELASQQKSFLVFVDQTNCSNANRMREFITNYAAETGVKPYRLMFSDLKNTDLKGKVKYYPSTVIISGGTPVAWLDADSDTDAPAYNDYQAYKTWLNQHLDLNP